MKEQLTSRDIRHIARGYWDDYFRWRWPHKVKSPWLIAIITFVAGAAIVVANSAASIAISAVAIILVLTAFGFFFKGLFDLGKDRDAFFDFTVDQWEKGEHQIPNTEMLIEFLKRQGG